MATVSKRTWTHKGEPRTAWITRWVDLGGKQRIKTFQTKKLADTYRNTVETEIRQGTHVAESASLTVREGCELWLHECSARVSRGEMTRHTYAFYEVRARLHIVPTLGIQKLSNLTAPMIIKWRKDLAEDTSRPRGQRTIAATVQCLSVMISEMQGLGLIRHNVVKETPLRRKHMRATKRRGKIPTRDEVRAIIAESRGRDRLIYQIAILCGLRKGEIRGLDWRHVDLDEREIRVRQKADKWGDTRYWELTLAEWGAVATLLLALAAVVGLWFTFYQVRRYSIQGKASFLFDLDQMFEGPDFTKTRAAFTLLRSEIEKNIDAVHGHQAAEGKARLIRDEFSRRLYTMRQDAPEDYLHILKLCGFFETVGLLVERDYVALKDIVGLYGGSIVRVEEALRTHLEQRMEEPGMPDGYFEHFRSLATKTRERMGIDNADKAK